MENLFIGSELYLIIKCNNLYGESMRITLWIIKAK